MRLGTLAALVSAVALVCIASAVTRGQESTNVVDSKVVSGDYKPLTFWGTLSLGASYYTNPQRAQTTTIAYSFDGPEFSDQHKSMALWDLAQQEKISFGIVDKKKKNIAVLPLTELQKQYTISGPGDLMKVLTRDDVIVVYIDKTLLGEFSKNLVVKTEPPPAKDAK
jgi:hypothetical protein